VCSTKTGSLLARANDFSYGYSSMFLTSNNCCREGNAIVCRRCAPNIVGMHGACGSVMTSFVHFNFFRSETCASVLFLGDGKNTFEFCQDFNPVKGMLRNGLALYPAFIPATTMIEYLRSPGPMYANVSKSLLLPSLFSMRNAVWLTALWNWSLLTSL
jgi:hypothetical protein